MVDRLTERERVLLQGVLERNEISDELAHRALLNELTRDERMRFCGLIMNEFLRVGLEGNDEPNALGIELEALLDTINRPNLKA